MSNWNLRYSRSLRQEGWGSGGFERNLSLTANAGLCWFSIGLSLGASLTFFVLKVIS